MIHLLRNRNMLWLMGGLAILALLWLALQSQQIFGQGLFTTAPSRTIDITDVRTEGSQIIIDYKIHDKQNEYSATAYAVRPGSVTQSGADIIKDDKGLRRILILGQLDPARSQHRANFSNTRIHNVQGAHLAVQVQFIRPDSTAGSIWRTARATTGGTPVNQPGLFSTNRQQAAQATTPPNQSRLGTTGNQAKQAGAQSTGSGAGSLGAADPAATPEPAKIERANDRVSAQTEFGNITNLGDYVKRIMAYALPIAVALAVLMTIYAGFLLMWFAGNPEKTKEAGEVIQGALIGLTIIILSRVLVDFLLLPDVTPKLSQLFGETAYAITVPTISPAATPVFDPNLGFPQARDALPEPRYQSFEELWTALIFSLERVRAVLVFFALIITGLMFLTTLGDPERMTRSRNNLFWVFVAILILLLAFWLLGTIHDYLQTNLPR